MSDKFLFIGGTSGSDVKRFANRINWLPNTKLLSPKNSISISSHLAETGFSRQTPLSDSRVAIRFFYDYRFQIQKIPLTSDTIRIVIDNDYPYVNKHFAEAYPNALFLYLVTDGRIAVFKNASNPNKVLRFQNNAVFENAFYGFPNYKLGVLGASDNVAYNRLSVVERMSLSWASLAKSLIEMQKSTLSFAMLNVDTETSPSSDSGQVYAFLDAYFDHFRMPDYKVPAWETYKTQNEELFNEIESVFHQTRFQEANSMLGYV